MNAVRLRPYVIEALERGVARVRQGVLAACGEKNLLRRPIHGHPRVVLALRGLGSRRRFAPSPLHLRPPQRIENTQSSASGPRQRTADRASSTSLRPFSPHAARKNSDQPEVAEAVLTNVNTEVML